MAFKKHWVITLKKLNSALADVRAELEKFGFWNPRLANIDVYLTWFGSAYGWQHYRGTGDIEIAVLSLCRLCEAIPGTESVPLISTLETKRLWFDSSPMTPEASPLACGKRRCNVAKAPMVFMCRR